MPKNSDGERSSRPRALIHDAQEACYRWEEMCQRHHQGLPTNTSLERAKKELHVAVMNYLRQLFRFKTEPQAEHKWADEPVFHENGTEMTLKDVFDAGGYRWGAYSDTVGGDVASTSKVMEIPQLMKVISKADEMAHELKFDAEPGESVADPEDATV